VITWSSVRPWLTWTGALVLTTVAMRLLRDNLDQVHVALVYLLVVLGASVGGSRSLGLTLACLATLLIDYFFQEPYDSLGIGRLDWTLLITFLATAVVATALLSQVRSEAAEARRRTEEVEWLSRLGAETLNAARAEDALARIAEVIQTTLQVRTCQICQWGPGGLCSGAIAGEVAGADPPGGGGRLERVARSGRALVVRTDGREIEGAGNGVGIHPGLFQISDAAAIYLPLQGATRVVGVLQIVGGPEVKFDAAQRRFLTALAYYTALGVERVYLVAEAAHAEALREADRMKDVLLASVSHDLRTPLTTIKAVAQDAALRGDEAAKVIEQQADRLGRLVANVLDLSRIKGGGVRVEPALNTAEDLLGAALAPLATAAQGRVVTLSLDLDRPALIGTFDFVQSLRVINNLIENAVRFTPPGATVELSVEREAHELVFTVADRGPGVAPAEVERIFEPFYRPAGAPPDVGRAGLGLAIARQLAELQGGSVQYQPRPGGGSLFVLRLPATDLDVASLSDGGGGEPGS
jgi:two-component system sensor histidine kinase KdpD